MDTNARVRTKAINLWTRLASQKAIPIKHFRYLLIKDISNRLKDNSVMVRKATVNLLSTILTFNPFGGNVCIFFKSNLNH